MPTLTFTQASHDPGKHGQPCHVINAAKVATVTDGFCPWHDDRQHNPADDIRCTIINTGAPDGCWYVQEPIEEVLPAIDAEKARALDSITRDIATLEHRLSSLEKDRNRRDELDAVAAVALERLRGYY